ncbi:MotA/TolQ/ExbB proton channel family protein [Photobacterium chitinilyticum]|nr:MotA/TolQ/ExbB proton channel family protein [Photobacterium chitinilyticum]
MMFNNFIPGHPRPKVMTATLLAITTLMASFASHSATISTVESSIRNDLKKSIQQYTAAEKQVRNERQPLSAQLNKLEKELSSLRVNAATVQRQKDEQYLGIEQLKKRLAQWKEQDAYINNLLREFNHNQSGITVPPGHTAQASKQGLAAYSSFDAIERSLVTLHQALRPQWVNNRSVLSPSGDIIQGQTLTAGPVQWFINATQAGLVDRTHQPLPMLIYTFDDDQQSQLNLHQQGQLTRLSLDPTLTRATALEAQQESIQDHLAKGGIWTIPILAFGSFALLIALFKAIQFIRLPKRDPALIGQILNREIPPQQGLTQATGYQQELIRLAVTHRHSGREVIDDLMYQYLLLTKGKLERMLTGIAATAAVAPLLGLLGTVTGMISTFKLLTLFGSGDESMLSTGIAQALITTELGLIVAIPALICHAYLTRRARRYLTALEADSVLLSQLGQIHQSDKRDADYA